MSDSISNWVKSLKFYLKYYLTNHVVNRIPSHGFRTMWYRHFTGIKMGPESQIWLGCQFVGDTVDQIEIGHHTVLASNVIINASAPVKIGDYVTVAHGVQILTADHDYQDPFFQPRKAPVVIESHAWIATSAIILKGVTIGNGAVVGAGSVVSQSIKSLAMVAGNPPRQFGTRSQPAEPSSGPLQRPLFC